MVSTFKQFTGFFVLLLVSLSATADSVNLLGFGGNQMAVAGSAKAKAYDGFSVAANPALMSSQETLTASFSMLGTYESFGAIDNVVVDNAYVGGSSTTYGNVKTNIPDAYLVQVGLVLPLGQTERKWRAGLALQLPLDKIAEAQTQDYYRPQFVLYQNDLQRLGLGFGLSTQLSPSLSAGFGLQLYFKTLGNMVTKMPTGGNTSSVNSAILMRPGYSPMAGLKYDLTEHQALSLGYAGAKDYRIEFDVEAAMQILSNPSPLVLTSGGSLFYDPETVSLAYSYTGDSWDLLGAVDLERWSPFDGGMFKVSFTTFTTNFSQFQFDTKFHDIFVPRLGFVKRLSGGDSFRAGLAYRPTPTPDLNQSMANFLDADRQIVGLGYTFHMENFLGVLDGPVDFGLQVQAQRLVPRHVTKLPTSQTASPLGFPGYDVSGTFVAYGLSLSTEL